MESQFIFPDLKGFEPTRDTLHAYSKVVGVVPRALAPFHSRWWHISLKVQAAGFVTDRMRAPDGGEFWLAMDLHDHEVKIQTEKGLVGSFDMTRGDPASVFGERVLSTLEEMGITGEYARGKFASDEPRIYEPHIAEVYFSVLLEIDRIFKVHRTTLEGETGPVQLWPHGFDLAFEWFGSRQVELEENGEVRRYPAQLSLGFSPGEPYHPEPYFYSNPWPFEAAALMDKPLPFGARWFTEGWQGSLLPYAALVGDSRAAERLLEYARVIYTVSRPTLVEASHG